MLMFSVCPSLLMFFFGSGFCDFENSALSLSLSTNLLDEVGHCYLGHLGLHVWFDSSPSSPCVIVKNKLFLCSVRVPSRACKCSWWVLRPSLCKPDHAVDTDKVAEDAYVKVLQSAGDYQDEETVQLFRLKPVSQFLACICLTHGCGGWLLVAPFRDRSGVGTSSRC